MTVLKKVWDLLLYIEKTVMIVASAAVAILIFISVIMRYIFEKNFSGMEELVVFVAFWIYFVGGIYGSYEGSHITADILSVFVHNELAKRIIALLRDGITFIILIAASYCCVELITYTAASGGSTSILKIPMMVIYLPIFVGIFMMTFYTFMHTIQDFLILIGKNIGVTGKEVEG